MPGDADLPGERHRILDRRAAGNSDLRREQHVAADRHAVRDLHEVVDLRSGADPRLADGGAIDRRIRPNLHVVFDDDIADLRDLLVSAIRACGEAEAIAADDRAVLNDDAVAELHAFPDRNLGVDHAVVTDAARRRQS